MSSGERKMAPSGGNGKSYGLILPKKLQAQQQKGVLSSGSVFQRGDAGDGGGGSSSSASEVDEGSGSTDWMRKKLESKSKAAARAKEELLGSTAASKKIRMKMEAALEEDPTVFQYDEVYDDMAKQRDSSVGGKSASSSGSKGEDRREAAVVKKPKYIENLLKQAQIRERERERRTERKVQKERQNEGEEFAGKEAFVTSAYRRKMEDMARQDEEDRRVEQLEDVLDVRKQKDLSGFYRHIFRQTMGEEKGQRAEETTQETPQAGTGLEEAPEKLQDKGTDVQPLKTKVTQKRSYRKNTGDPAEDEETGDSDTDSSTTSTSSSSKDDPDTKVDQERPIKDEKMLREEARRLREKRERRKRRIERGEDSSSDDDQGQVDHPTTCSSKEAKVGEEADAKHKEPGRTDAKGEDTAGKSSPKKAPRQPKVNVWEKVTVGPVFEAALQRYFERKASRQPGWPLVAST